MGPEDNLFLKTFFQNVVDSPLSPQDERYIPLYEDPSLVGFDPVEMLARAIAWAPGESVQLLSGFRGTGKSTELRRLQNRLQDEGNIVLLCDMEEAPQPIDAGRRERLFARHIRGVQRLRNAAESLVRSAAT